LSLEGIGAADRIYLTVHILDAESGGTSKVRFVKLHRVKERHCSAV